MMLHLINNGRKDVQKMVPLKHVSNFWRTLKMPLINCEINILTWSEKCILVTEIMALMPTRNQNFK